MIVYIELLFIYNTVINFILLMLVEKIYNNKIKYKKLIIASICGGGMFFCYLLSNTIFKALKIFGGTILILIISTNKGRNKLISEIITFYSLNFAFTGVLSTFQINTLVPLLMVVASIFTLVIIFKNKKLNTHRYYKVKIDLANKTYHLDGFYDSGNLSRTSDNIPIIFINSKFKEQNLKFIELINIQTIAGNKLLPCYEPNSCIVKVNNQQIAIDVAICFVEMEKECLLNGKIFMEEEIICQEAL